MNEFRPASSYRSYGGGHDGRDLEIIAVKTQMTTGGRLQGTVRSCSLQEYNYKNPYDNPSKNGRIVKRNKTPKKKSASAFSWSWNDPENKRKARVAKYKYYTVEGKVKSSIKKGYRWFKIKCSHIIRGL